MNKRNLIIINFLILIFYSCTVSSYTSGLVYLESNNQVIQNNEEVEITIFMQDVETVAYNIYLYFDNSKVEYVSGPDNTNVVENCVVSVWHDNTGGSNSKSGELEKYIFRAKENGIALFSIEGEFYNADEELIKMEFKDYMLQIGETSINNQNSDNEFKEDTLEENYDISNNEFNEINQGNLIEEFEGSTNFSNEENTNLEVLAIENILLYPAFDTNITEYDAEISEENNVLNIFAVPENENASLEIFGNQDLKEGKNIIKIIVTAQNGISKKEYRINAYKRNNEEEIEYQQKQETNKQKLEEIYKAEKVNLEIENFEEENLIDVEKQNSKKNNLILVLLIILFITSIVVGKIYKVRKKNSN